MKGARALPERAARYHAHSCTHNATTALPNIQHTFPSHQVIGNALSALRAANMKSNKKSTSDDPQMRARQKYSVNDESGERTSLMCRSREAKAPVHAFCPVYQKEIGKQIETKNNKIPVSSSSCKQQYSSGSMPFPRASFCASTGISILGKANMAP